jgi:hypothetical protein
MDGPNIERVMLAARLSGKPEESAAASDPAA